MAETGNRQSVAILGTRGYPSFYGGFETAVRKLAPYLADQGWDVTVYGRKGVLAGDGVADPRVRSRLTPGIETRSLSTLSYGLTSIADAALRRPDVALVMNVANGYWLPLLKARGVPTVVNVDGIEWERDKWSRLGKSVFRAGASLTARWADRLVVDSLAIGDYWTQEFGRNGDFIPYGGDEVGPLPLEPGLEAGRYALVVARFVPENSIPEFIAAAATISRTHDVVFVGSSGYGGELEERVAALAEKSPRVRWTGHISDHHRLLALWQHAGVYFHGHTVGGTNPALVQAMMCGAPVVARDTVYSREVLGDGARLVDGDPNHIAEEVLAVLKDRQVQSEMGEASLARARSRYTWKGVCDAYVQSLELAIEGRRRPRG